MLATSLLSPRAAAVAFGLVALLPAFGHAQDDAAARRFGLSAAPVAVMAVASPSNLIPGVASSNAMSTGVGVDAILGARVGALPVAAQVRWSRHDYRAGASSLALAGESDLLRAMVVVQKPLGYAGRLSLDAGAGALVTRSRTAFTNTGEMAGLPGVSGQVNANETAPLLAGGATVKLLTVGTYTLATRAGVEVAFGQAGRTILAPLSIQVGR